MKNSKPLAASIAALFLALVTPVWSSANTSRGDQSPCTSSGNFTVTLGYNSSTQTPTATPSSNSTCVIGGSTVSFTTSNLAGMTWTAAFPTTGAGTSVFTNNCTFGSGTGQSSSCTVISGPTAGDYHYTVTVTDSNGNNHVLDPKVIIGNMGHPTPRHRQKKSSSCDGTAAPAQPQQ
jgi:hypothetical protein